MARVVLAMSGGVDSSVAAWLLRQQGHEVIGLFMRHGQPGATGGVPGATGGLSASACSARADKLPVAPALPVTPAPRKQGCCSAADAADARRVADLLGIPFYALNFQAEFGRIVEYFVAEYTAGRTPNPCIVCNTWLKFGKLMEYADSVGAEFVATGHYARLVIADGQPALCRAGDPAKDQSYVLFGIPRTLLARLFFPVGDYPKEEIRGIAARLGLEVADKPDSQEICFIPQRDHARFVRQHRPPEDTSGPIITTEGTVVGRHAGLEHFTIGQRKGLGLAFGEPRYVVRLDQQRREVVIGTRDELARKQIDASGANWLIDEPTEPIRCGVKIRYRSRALPALVAPLSAGRFRVCFDEPCTAAAPGQAAVCYDGDRVLGGGWIEP